MPTVVVTGATGAIGSATVAALVKRRAQVVSLSRPSLDLSSTASVRAAARELNRTVRHIDALLNIAAVYSTTYRKNGDGIELMLATNHLGPFLLTNLLRDRVSRGARVCTGGEGVEGGDVFLGALLPAPCRGRGLGGGA